MKILIFILIASIRCQSNKTNETITTAIEVELNATKIIDLNCEDECTNGTRCFQITETIYRCATRCRKTWKCDDLFGKLRNSERILTKEQEFVPLITPEEFTRAVKAAGYSKADEEKFHNLVSQAEMAGGITTKRELAMFLTQILWESDGLAAKREYACAGPNGCPESYRTGTDLPGRQYYGRGYIQLTYSGNYKSASYDLFKDDRLLKNPDLVAEDDQIAWATAFWFWKANVGYRQGVEEGHFGVTTLAINGILECNNGPNVSKAKIRFQMYTKILKALNLDETPIEGGCY
ncbi:unnamed protein product [Brachionus calyciflorus]|uniref:Glycoside hydrolase family 19 catalytic domain-containing protein n=1 Tax=Brachionus calyciflorus TaxID=104777 RepID=A0A813M446_9BILA|nr:unnamed protein product [Brachionus calyciflorus]